MRESTTRIPSKLIIVKRYDIFEIVLLTLRSKTASTSGFLCSEKEKKRANKEVLVSSEYPKKIERRNPLIIASMLYLNLQYVHSSWERSTGQVVHFGALLSMFF